MQLYNKVATTCFLALSFPVMGMAQVEGSALDHMLQRPRVTKQYTHKRAFDHLFIDAGAGVNFMGSKHPKAGVEADFNVGDWITPEHGLRLNFNGGAYRIHDMKPKFFGAGLDYMLNITALSQRGTSYVPRTVEFYGIAGLDFTMSHCDRRTEHGVGAHLALRSQVALSPYTYFYLEPRIGVQQDEVSQVYTWHGYRPVASASLGFGYRLPESSLRHALQDSTQTSGKWTDGLIVGLAGGPLFFANAQPSSWKHNAGGRMAVSIGKWFDPYSALRLTASGTTFKQQGASRVKAIGLQADYLLNLHNAFGGVRPDGRRFWINGVAGLSWNTSSDHSASRRNSFGMGGGLQGNLRLTRDLDFTLEPRVDAYRNDYAPHLTTARDWDLTASLLAGLTYTYHDRSATQPAPDPYEQTSWHDHMFVEMGLGGNLPVTKSAAKHPTDYLRPQLYAGIGKWFTPVHGLRFWGQLAQTQTDQRPTRHKHFDFGADYLLNLTNAFYGYRTGRPFEFSASAGVNLSHRQHRDALFLGGDAALRATWNVNPFLGIYVEPRLQGYGRRYLPVRCGQDKVDFVASAMAGVQFNMQGFDRAAAYGRMNEDGQGLRRSISVAAGLSTPANHLRASEYYAPVGRISYTQWYTPLSAWRVNAQALVRGEVHRQHLMQVKAGADWMTDLTAQTYGYDISRPLSIRAYAGFNLGFDRGGGRTYFAPDLHLGGQMAVRLTDDVHLTVEPQASYEMSRRFKGEKLGRWMPQLMVGLDYSLESHKRDASLSARPELSHFISMSVGMGGYTGNFNEMPHLRRKLTFTSDVAYGQWVNQVSGFQLGLGHTLAQRRGKGNESITSIHADYMMNLLSAMSGEPTEGQLFQLTGLAGASLGISSREGRSAKVAPGVQASIQAGFRVSPHAEVYLEPAASVHAKHLEPSDSHPFEGELKLNVGTKFYF